MNTRGFMQCTIDAIMRGPADHIGVQLGKVMVSEYWSVVAVADHLGISRQGLYNIVTAKSYPRAELRAKIEDLLNRAK